MEYIFYALNKASDRNNAYHRIRQLEYDINHMKNRCGSCYYWMKTSLCPRENNGHKVTCNESICERFKIDNSTDRLIKSHQLEVGELKQKHSL